MNINFDSKEWDSIPRVVQNALRVVLGYVEDIKRTVTVDDRVQERLSEKADIRDVYNSLQQKADIKIVKDITIRWSERLHDLEGRVGGLTRLLQNFSDGMDDISRLSEISNMTTINNTEINNIKSSIEFLSTEIAQDRDTWTDLQCKLDALHQHSEIYQRTPPRRGFVTGNIRKDETNLSISTLTPTR